jgi:uncharacterized protein (TIGR03435 family)
MFRGLALLQTMALGMTWGTPLDGQILHAEGPLPSFEVATIKPMEPTRFTAPPSGGVPLSGGGGGAGGEQIVSRQEVHISKAPPLSDRVSQNMTAKMLIGYAYNLPAFSKAQILGGPDWADQTMYQIQAKIDDAQYAAMQKMPQSQQVQEIQLMEQSLLAERFKLKVHFETREMPVYALEVAKGGFKLTPAKTESASDPAQAIPTTMSVVDKVGGVEITAKGVQPSQLILMLQQQPELGNRRVVDHTGLSGHYDFSLDWTREGAATTDAGSATADAAPSFFTALKEELGLQLVETKAPVEVIVIDSIARPSEN